LYFSLLVNLKIDIVHIRHLFKHSFELPNICRLLGLGVVFSFHDFYHVCPSIHLLDQDNKYCNGQCKGTGQCRISTPLLEDLPQLREFLPEWQKAVSSMINVCDTFVTTSEFTKKVYVNAYPALKNKQFKVIEHGRDFITGLKDCHTIPDNKSKVKILITGNIEVHKGSRFIKQLHDQDNNGRIELHFLGTIPKELEGCGINHGTFERDNFYNEVSKISPSFIGIFSIWPETFCHTLTEAWACGIPVLAFNIGTVADRVLHHDAGWLLDMEDVKASYDQILDIAEKPFEYERVLSKVKKIRFKTTREMADEYLIEYRKIMLTDKGKRQHKTIALFTPHGSNGFPGSSHVRCLLPLQHPDF
ncbi:MAG: glycosyltransferase, partial [Desulfobacteraceae bacterium]|nr:glycosyltransferase [Desulfobacteraceae bacterium]